MRHIHRKTLPALLYAFICGAFAISFSVAVAAQSGGMFEITGSVIAGGGTTASSGDIDLESTIGQPITGGVIANDPFAVTSGFWNFTPLVPTAAQVSISGRVLSSAGVAIPNAALFLQMQSGEIYLARSSPFGYYMFEGIAAGQSVFITVEHKHFTFEPRAIMVVDNVTDLDFVAQ